MTRRSSTDNVIGAFEADLDKTTLKPTLPPVCIEEVLSVVDTSHDDGSAVPVRQALARIVVGEVPIA